MMTPAKVLIIEDDFVLSTKIADLLRLEEYDVATKTDGVAGLLKIQTWRPDIVLLDILLPEIDGLSILRIIRRDPDVYNVLVILISGRGLENDKIFGLDNGADAYLTKPVEFGVVLSTIRAVLRRKELRKREVREEEDRNILISGNLTANVEKREGYIDGEELKFTVKMFDLLVVLMKNKGRALSKGFILEAVWGGDALMESISLNVHIRWLRKLIEVDSSDPKRIVTVRSVGFRFDG